MEIARGIYIRVPMVYNIGTMKIPTGTVTFLFTDIEGSTRLWQEHPVAMKTALERHHAILREAIEQNGGYVFQIIGDAFCASFGVALNGLIASVEAQKRLALEPWGDTGAIKVRMALHAGEASVVPGDHVSGEYESGITLSRAARLLSAGHGGQVLASEHCVSLLGDSLPGEISLLDLGERHLRDLIKPERIFQVTAEGLEKEFPPLKTLDGYPNNIPSMISSFIGREKELDEIKAHVAKHRLVTLCGPGGCGKTRLACQAAFELSGKFPQGAWFVELASITDPNAIELTVARMFGIREQTDRPTRELLADYLSRRNALIILDNCEHVAAQAGEFVAYLLGRTSEPRILCTSWEQLGIAGEIRYRVSPLSLPESTIDISDLLKSEAVRLFIVRASEANPHFELNDTNGATVARICKRLDGIPLALELAAARINAFSPARIAELLEGSFKLLSDGNKGAQPRQRTLTAAMEWGHGLLSDGEKKLMRRLAVFSGRFTLDAATYICDSADEGETAGTLASCIGKSLVQNDERGGDSAYAILNTLRLFFLEKLTESGEDNDVRSRHFDWHLRLAEYGEPELSGENQEKWLESFESLIGDFREGLEWAVKQGECERGLSLCGALWFFWYVRGYCNEGLRWLWHFFSRCENCEKCIVSEPVLARALHGAAVMARRQGELRTASEFAWRAHSIYERSGDRKGLAYSLNVLGLISHHLGEDDTAVRLLEESLSLFRETGDRRGIAYCLTILGSIAFRKGNDDEAKKFCGESITLRRELRDKRGVALDLRFLGGILMRQGEWKEAAVIFQECSTIFGEVGDRWGKIFAAMSLGKLAFRSGDTETAKTRYHEAFAETVDLGDRENMAACAEGLAEVAASESDFERSATLLGAAESLRKITGAPLPQVDRESIGKIAAMAEAKLGEVRYRQLADKGGRMTVDDLSAY